MVFFKEHLHNFLSDSQPPGSCFSQQSFGEPIGILHKLSSIGLLLLSQSLRPFYFSQVTVVFTVHLRGLFMPSLSSPLTVLNCLLRVLISFLRCKISLPLLLGHFPGNLLSLLCAKAFSDHVEDDSCHTINFLLSCSY